MHTLKEHQNADTNEDKLTNATLDKNDSALDIHIVDDVLTARTEDFRTAMNDDMNTPRALAVWFKVVGMAEKYAKLKLNRNLVATSKNHRNRNNDTDGNGNNEEESKSNTVISISPVISQKFLDWFNTVDQVLGVLYDVPSTYFNTKGSSSSAANNSNDASDSNCVDPDCECIPTDSSNSSTANNDNNNNAGVLEEVTALAQQRITLKKQKLFKEADHVRDEISRRGFGLKDTKNGFELFEL